MTESDRGEERGQMSESDQGEEIKVKKEDENDRIRSM